MPKHPLIVSTEALLTDALQRALDESGESKDAQFLATYPSVDELLDAEFNRSLPPDVYIIGLTERSLGIELISTICERRPGSLVLAANTTAAGDVIIEALNAGAAHFLAPPITGESIRACFSKHSAAQEQAPARTARGRIYAITPAEGGNGSSTVSVHMAHHAAQALEKRVLLIDFDFLCGAIAFTLNLEPSFTLADTLQRIDIIEEVWPRVVVPWGQVDVLAAPSDETVDVPNSAAAAQTLLTSAALRYPAVFVDLPPGIVGSTREAMRLADSTIIVAGADVKSLHLAKRRVHALRQLGMPDEAIQLVLNRVGSSRSLSELEVLHSVGLPVFATLSNDYKAVVSAQIEGATIDDGTELGRELRALGHSLIGFDEDETEEKRSGWRRLFA